MPGLTSCIFENSDFTGAANCNSVQSGGWAWVTWTFGNRWASLARWRLDSEIVIPLVPILDTAANRALIDGTLPSEASRSTNIRAGMVPYSRVEYFAANPTRHPAGLVLVDMSFRLDISLPWYCSDASATVHYYVHLFLNAAQRLTATVDGWGRSGVTGGLPFCQGSVGSQLSSAILGGMAPLQAALNAQLAAFSALTFSNIYFLPGDGRTSGRDDVANVRNEAAVVIIP